MPQEIIKETKSVEEEIKEKQDIKLRLISALVIFTLLILGGGLFYSNFEYYPNTSQNWSYLDSVYFAAMTVTTIGYGDIVPTTTIGKIFTIFYAFIGIAITFYVAFLVGRFLMHFKIVFLKKWLKFFWR